MNYLDSEVSRLNEKLSEGLGSLPVFKASLTNKVVDKGGVAINDLDGNRIHVDDKFDLYFYHRLKSKSYVEVISHGMVNKFHADASIDLFVFSKIDALEYFESKLNDFSSLKINSLDNDSYAIFQAETQAKEYDFNKYFIFSINYNLNYKLKKCLEL
jgi:hypothetical protein